MDQDTRTLAEQLRALEARVARIEQALSTTPAIPEEVEPAPARPVRSEEEIEFQVGQYWFARVGIVILAAGFAFLLTLPYEDWPSFLPGLLGYGLAAAVFALSRAWRSSFALISGYLWGGAMALLYFATLRFFFFAQEPALTASSPFGMLLLVAVSVLNIVLGIKRRSPYLISLALTTTAVTPIAVGTPWFVLSYILAFAVAVSWIGLRNSIPGVLLYGTILTYVIHFNWGVGNPLGGNSPVFATEPVLGLYLILLMALILAAGSLLRADRATEKPLVALNSLINAGSAYGLYLILTLGGFEDQFAWSHVAASVVLLAVAVVFWTREQSRYSTFVYAMTGYAALSVAIIKAFDVPVLFVWLSLQSLVVVTTAVWFRSRFIVVANFVIYVMIMIGYLIVAAEETGISIGFGVVALASARILNWQKDRLELKTEMMRNAYLFAAFAVFPYALYHLVPTGFVTLAWIGTALLYYLMNLATRSPKYRWMAHGTLMLTALYVVVIGIIRLTPTLRVVSFLVLAVVLLAVSMIFTRSRARRKEEHQDPPA